MTLIAVVMIPVVLAYVAALAYLAIRQRAFIYFPHTDAIAPAAAGLPKAEAISIATRDGERLKAWFIPARGDQPLLVYFHGNAGHLANLAGRFAVLSASGAGLLAIDYRGYGGSSGAPTEAGLHLDADAAYAEALARGFAPQRIVLIGESLGTGVAVALASRHAVAGVILEAAYTSAADIGAAIYWMFPVRLMMIDSFRSDLRVSRIRAPLLFLHGTEDATIPIRFAERLYAMAPEPKRFLRVEGGGHQVMQAPEAAREIRAFVAACR